MNSFSCLDVLRIEGERKNWPVKASYQTQKSLKQNKRKRIITSPSKFADSINFDSDHNRQTLFHAAVISNDG